MTSEVLAELTPASGSSEQKAKEGLHHLHLPCACLSFLLLAITLIARVPCAGVSGEGSCGSFTTRVPGKKCPWNT